MHISPRAEICFRYYTAVTWGPEKLLHPTAVKVPWYAATCTRTAYTLLYIAMVCSSSAAPYMLIGSFQLQYVFYAITFGKENIAKAQAMSNFISKSDHMMSCVWFLQTWNASFQQGMKPGKIHMVYTFVLNFCRILFCISLPAPKRHPVSSP